MTFRTRREATRKRKADRRVLWLAMMITAASFWCRLDRTLAFRLMSVASPSFCRGMNAKAAYLCALRKEQAGAGILVSSLSFQYVSYSQKQQRQVSSFDHGTRRLATPAATSTDTTSSSSLSSDQEITATSPDDTDVLCNLQSTFLQTMRDRGFLHQCTNLVALDEKLSSGQVQSAYLGFDATAESLHVGSLLQIMILRHLQKSGHRPVVLIGGGTSKVGDPTGKDESRIMLTEDIIQKNTAGISRVFQKFLQFDLTTGAAAVAPATKTMAPPKPTDALMVNNDEWLSQLKYLDFLREYGTHFTINRMLSFESVKQRLNREAPFSFLEFNYMILQAYDFLELYRRYNTILQLGGSDQWGNMVSGTELGRRVDGVQLFALTAPLITTSDGKKMGKTATGAVWLNADKLSEYDYWQFWRNTADDDVIRFLKLFTELPLEEIAVLEQLQGADINQAKVVLADEATALLHGRECLLTIHETVQTMFAGAKSSTEGLPRIYVNRNDLDQQQQQQPDGGNQKMSIRLIDLLVDLKLATSKKEARRLIQGGGARLGETKIEDENITLGLTDFGTNKEITLRAGKKRAGVIELVD